MGVYSFAFVKAAISGPGGSFDLGTGVAEEGITTSSSQDVNVPFIGADGRVMNAVKSGTIGRVFIRYLKTSPVNSKLVQLYSVQTSKKSTWGNNVITGRDVFNGDAFTLSSAAFVKLPDVTWDKDGKTIEWEFVGILNEQLGAGGSFLDTISNLF